MKVLSLESIGNLVYKDQELRELKAGEVLVQIKACGICSSDIDRVFKTGTYHFPTVPGHEFAGQIVKLGEGVDPSLLNRRTSVFPLLPCFKCEPCSNEEYARCDNYNYFGSRCDGGFSEYLIVPVWNLVLCSDELPYKVAALCEPASVAKHAYERAGISGCEGNKKANVLVFGSGTIGFLIALWAMKDGNNVSIVCRNDKKIAFAKELGIQNVYDSREFSDITEAFNNQENKPDVVFEGVGSSQSISDSVSIVKKGGKVVVVGNPTGNIELERNVYWKILRGELQVIGTWNSNYSKEHNNWKQVIAEFEKDPELFAKLITDTYSLEEHNKAFAKLRDKQQFTVKSMFINE